LSNYVEALIVGQINEKLFGLWYKHDIWHEWSV
jgi:hypothetical protein